MNWKNVVLLACILAGTVVLCGLGFWQLDRLEWKEAMIARVQANVAGPPASLAQIEARKAAGDDIEYNPVQVTGTFDHAGEQYYVATFKGAPGRFVYTPMRLADERMLWVNRGFVPQSYIDPATRSDGLIEGAVTITGLARDTIGEKPNTFVPDNDLAKRTFYWKSLPQMAANAYDKTERSTADLFVDAGVTPDQDHAWPIGGVTRVTFANSHLQYAFTWFGLASALVFVGGLFLMRRLRDTKAAGA